MNKITSPLLNACLIPNGFSVYGTLRDDDDSGAAWTAKFLKGMDKSKAQTAYVKGFRLYQNKVDNYPFALLTNNVDDMITTRLISFEPDLLPSKLVEADEIEG